MVNSRADSAPSSAAGRPPRPWPHRLALVTAGETMMLIFVGGLVTNTGSALAVPDGPTTFGHNMFLFPWSRMIGGIFYDHAHRLIGSGVGLLTIALAITLWLAEPRAWARALGVVAVAAGVLRGGLPRGPAGFLPRALPPTPSR